MSSYPNGNYKSTMVRAARLTPPPGALVFTTGQVAALCHVAPRTVCKWFDAGKLTGYRLPTDDRRVSRASLLEFLGRHGMKEAAAYLSSGQSVALAGLPEIDTLAFGQALPGGWTVEVAPNLFFLGLVLPSVAAAVVDASLGRGACLETGKLARQRFPNITLVALTYDDDVERWQWAEHGYDSVLVRPVTPAEVLRAVRGE